MHKKEVIIRGIPLGESKKVLIMLHGRGASAEDILGLGEQLDTDTFTLMAPQATNQTWYPYSFLAPVKENEPWLSSALSLISDIVEEVVKAGIDKKNIYFLGFSQGACLAIEFVTRNAERYGGAIIFTGGLIGEKIHQENYTGSFEGTPVLIGTSDPDMHVPVERVRESALILESMNAAVTLKIYPGLGHSINQDELGRANLLLHAASSGF